MIKKSIITFSLCSLLSFSPSYAGLEEEFESSMDDWQTSYPVLKVVRQHDDFRRIQTVTVPWVESKGGDSAEAMRLILKKFVPCLIQSPEYKQGDEAYYLTVELLEPVWRDAYAKAERKLFLPTVSGHDEFTTVHRIIATKAE